ncbi:glyoxalase superfamily protein [Rubellimicrobium arenae]|uniref:glyoxalase superfamily protein n=2 Tax=Rubellimicrobium arenae TaxID=2817372 RepID=UPI001FEF5675|nr:glyoxalase superfamily protein [Rubellimicrobium arenae]
MIRLTNVRTTMTSHVKALSREFLKTEARTWRGQRQAMGASVTHGAALEVVARRHGFRDWNTACAHLPERDPTPLAPSNRVTGTYLGHPFEGVLLAATPLGSGQTSVTVQFDAPINVTAGSPYAHMRRRVTATLDEDGTSPARTGNGEPHMRLQRA